MASCSPHTLVVVADVCGYNFRWGLNSTVAVTPPWARCDTDTAVTLRIDWEAIGLDPAKARIEQPAIAKLQAARHTFSPEPTRARTHLRSRRDRAWCLS